MKKQLLVIVLLLFCSSIALAQNKNIFDPDSVQQKKTISPDSLKNDSIRKSADLQKVRPFPLPDPNPKEIKFYHRYWRDIDVTDKRNQILAVPGNTLIEALLKGLKDGKITVYDPQGGTADSPAGDAFIAPMTYGQVMSHLSDTAYVDQFDKDGNKTGSVAKANPFTPDKITGFRIKEDVYYDKQRGKIVTRIIGLAALQKLTLSSGDSVGTQPLFWVRFKDSRRVLVTVDVDNPHKKIGLTLDDIFLQHRFVSTLVEESNPAGARIRDYATSADTQVKEAQRIEVKLSTYKKTMFSYTLSEVDPVPDLPKKTIAKTAQGN